MVLGVLQVALARHNTAHAVQHISRWYVRNCIPMQASQHCQGTLVLCQRLGVPLLEGQKPGAAWPHCVSTAAAATREATTKLAHTWAAASAPWAYRTRAVVLWSPEHSLRRMVRRASVRASSARVWWPFSLYTVPAHNSDTATRLLPPAVVAPPPSPPWPPLSSASPLSSLPLPLLVTDATVPCSATLRLMWPTDCSVDWCSCCTMAAHASTKWLDSDRPSALLHSINSNMRTPRSNSDCCSSSLAIHGG